LNWLLGGDGLAAVRTAANNDHCREHGERSQRADGLVLDGFAFGLRSRVLLLAA
jgi:hypothetical protein